MSKDLSSDKNEFHDATEPDAQNWVSLRNHLEHQYVKVHNMSIPDKSDPVAGDRLAYSVQFDDFVLKTLQIMRTARAALIYLSLAVFCEEEDRKAKRPSDVLIPGSILPHLEDEDKRLW